jgi:hypothetical protein
MIKPNTTLADEGADGLAAAIAEAEQDNSAWLKKLAARDPVPGDEREGTRAGEWDADDIGLPPDCPVIPLGVDGKTYWFLDTLGQLNDMASKDFSQNNINALFMGRHLYLYWAWPRKDKDGAVVAWRAEKVRETLMAACAHKGPWDAVERARGRGAWLMSDGSLAVHCGTQLYAQGHTQGLGEYDGDVYMTRPPVMHPWPKPMGLSGGPAVKLHALLKTFNWERPDMDPVLFMGWIGAAMIGGALPWRPAIYMTGDKATGKSTLQKIMKMIFGNMLIKAADTTAAGIYQNLRSDSLPVAVDELEGKADNRKAKAILELARLAASGDLMLRGGSEHKGTQFNARSCFAFSSINSPPLEPQDLSRMALLRLRRLPQGSTPPDLDQPKLARMGRMIMRQMIDGWPRFTSTWNFYRAALSRAGHDSRGQDTFGTLLACADLLIGNDAGELQLPMQALAEDGKYWADLFEARHMVEYEDAEENWRLCLNHVLSAPIEAWKGGGQQTMGEVLERLWHGKMDFDEARALSQKTGLTLLKPTLTAQHMELFIPNNHTLLTKLFFGSKWQGELGAGVWSGALRQAPQDTYRVAQGWVTGVKAKGTAFKLETVLNRVAPLPVATPAEDMRL